MFQAHNEIPAIRLHLTSNEDGQPFHVSLHCSRPLGQGFMDSMVGKATPEGLLFREGLRALSREIGHIAHASIESTSLVGHSFSDLGENS